MKPRASSPIFAHIFRGSGPAKKENRVSGVFPGEKAASCRRTPRRPAPSPLHADLPRPPVTPRALRPLWSAVARHRFSSAASRGRVVGKAEGLKPGDALIAAYAEAIGADVLVSENRHFLGRTTGLPFAVHDAKSFIETFLPPPEPQELD